jgi:hypothetical protein
MSDPNALTVAIAALALFAYVLGLKTGYIIAVITYPAKKRA